MENVKGQIGDKITYADNPNDALKGADALMIMTEWPVFRTPDFDKIKKELKRAINFRWLEICMK